MQEEILIQISNKLKEERKAKGVTLQRLADQAQVSKGLISQIENNRTIPSLLVLLNLIRSLDVNLDDFFSDLQEQSVAEKVIVKRSEDYQSFEKEQAKGFTYRRIMTRTVRNTPIDIVLLELKKGATRSQMVKTDAFEYKYLISGKVEYAIGQEKYVLEAGDSIYFDARLPHKPTNIGDSEAVMLVLYIFNEK